jgi:hypothetical protein
MFKCPVTVTLAKLLNTNAVVLFDDLLLLFSTGGKRSPLHQ